MSCVVGIECVHSGLQLKLTRETGKWKLRLMKVGYSFSTAIYKNLVWGFFLYSLFLIKEKRKPAITLVHNLVHAEMWVRFIMGFKVDFGRVLGVCLDFFPLSQFSHLYAK